MQAEYIDHLGDDLRVVNAARVSFDKESDWGWFEPIGNDPNPPIVEKEGLRPSDQKLIKYLANHDHWTPFSHVMVTMRETVPIFVARQRFKHMIGFTYNEVSRRYVDDPPKFFRPETWRGAPENRKQGSSDVEIVDLRMQGFQMQTVNAAYEKLIQHAETLYRDMIEAGVAPEQARMVLPQSMYTSYYTTGSLPAWARAYKLRVDTNAQKEIQELAAQWNKVISSIPELKYSWNALIE